MAVKINPFTGQLDITSSGSGSGSTPVYNITRGNFQSYNASTVTLLNIQADVSTAGITLDATNNTLSPDTSGRYQMSAFLGTLNHSSPTANALIEIDVLVNGTIVYDTEKPILTGMGTQTFSIEINRVLDLAAGDLVRVEINNTSDIAFSANINRTGFSLIKID